MFDDLDRKLLHALQLDGRAPFSRIADVLGVAGRTVARRYQRLRDTGAVRVLGLADSRRVGWSEWFVRMGCLPSGAEALAAALARHYDISWVTVLSGGAEVSCLVHATDQALLDRVGRAPGVRSVAAFRILRPFMDEEHCWRVRISALDEDEMAMLRPAYGDGTTPMVVLNDLDERLLPALAVDGRAAYPGLARTVGWSESVIRRRVNELRQARVLSFSVETDARLFGYTAEYMVWITAAPGRTTAIGQALAQDLEIAFVAATSGPANLVGYVVCRDADALYDYLTERVGALDGVQGLRSAPVTSYAKRIGAIPERARLGTPPVAGAG